MSNLNSLSIGWQEYFSHIPHAELEDTAVQLSSLHLIQQDSPRLFSDRGDIEEWESLGSDQGKIGWVSSCADVKFDGYYGAKS